MLSFIFRRILLLIPTLIGVAQASAQQPREASWWVKVCDPDRSCYVLHERRDGSTGDILIAAAAKFGPDGSAPRFYASVMRKDHDYKDARLIVHSRDQWAAISQGDKPSGAEVPASMALVGCAPKWCSFETELSKPLLDGLRTDGGLLIQVIAGDRPIGFPASLFGFNASLEARACDHHCFYHDRALNLFRPAPLNSR